jgi:hypothetical protein
MSVPRCPRCGHNFYDDSPTPSGVCTYCQDEINNPVYCHVCNAVATCTGHKGHLCDRQYCADMDSLEWEKEQRYDDEY